MATNIWLSTALLISRDTQEGEVHTELAGGGASALVL
jgi:hypothetical protein